MNADLPPNGDASPVTDRPAQRRRIKQMEVMVADVVAETADTTTLVLFTGNDHLDYKAGHFLTIDPHQFDGLERFIAYIEEMKGKREPPRAYSMSSAPHEKYLAFTVKEERYVPRVTKYPPLLSPLLVKGISRGTRMIVTGFTGPYTLPDDVESRTDHLVHVCAGSGSVPNFSILKYALEAQPGLRHTFVYSNRTWDDVIFREPLAQLQARHPDRLKVVHTLTRDEAATTRGAGVRKGRLTADLLKSVVPDPKACLVYACGPAISPWDRQAAKAKGTVPEPRFLEAALEAIGAIGVPSDRIAHESYG